MRKTLFFLAMVGLTVSCSDMENDVALSETDQISGYNLDTDSPPVHEAEIELLNQIDNDLETESPSGKSFGFWCRPFPPNFVLATKFRYKLKILESNSDFINHIFLVRRFGPDFFVGTDDETGKTVHLPPVFPGREMVFKIVVHDPDGNPTGDVWYSGDPSRNADGETHALIERCFFRKYRVNFEDIDGSGYGVGDEPNFVDAIFMLY